MFWSNRFPITRMIAAIGLVQMIVALSGWVALAIILKTRGWGRPDVIFRFSDLADFLRTHPLLALLFPAAWTLWATWYEGSSRGDSNRIVLGSGILGILALLIPYLEACINPGVVPILLPR